MTTKPLEQRMKSSLLYTKPDGTQDFVHDTYRDFFSAKYFADRINDGRLNTVDVYNKHLDFQIGFEGDEELFNFIFPLYRDFVRTLGALLNSEKCRELVENIQHTYQHDLYQLASRKKGIPGPSYRLAIYDVALSAEIIAADPLTSRNTSETFSFLPAARARRTNSRCCSWGNCAK